MWNNYTIWHPELLEEGLPIYSRHSADFYMWQEGMGGRYKIGEFCGCYMWMVPNFLGGGRKTRRRETSISFLSKNNGSLFMSSCQPVVVFYRTDKTSICISNSKIWALLSLWLLFWPRKRQNRFYFLKFQWKKTYASCYLLRGNTYVCSRVNFIVFDVSTLCVIAQVVFPFSVTVEKPRIHIFTSRITSSSSIN